MSKFATTERIIDYPSGPQSVESQIIAHMVAQLGRQSCVYFVGFNRWVKIGFSSCVFTRLEKLDCMPEPVVLLALIPGDRHIEWGLHDQFAKYHSHAEWFLHEGKLADYIQKLRDAAQRKCVA
jgi:hypothetical protein